MKKSISIFFALLLALCLIFAACGGKDSSQNGAAEAGENDPTEKPGEHQGPSDIRPIPVRTAMEMWKQVYPVSGYGEMTLVPERDYFDVYGVDSSRVADSVWYMSENPSKNADEAAIFKLADEGYVEDLAGVFRARIERQIKVAEAYSPAEAEKLRSAEVVVNGSWVYFFVGENASAMSELIDTFIKK